MPTDALRHALQRHRDGDAVGAATAYRRVLESGADEVLAATNLARLLLGMGRSEEAAAVLDAHAAGVIEPAVLRVRFDVFLAEGRVEDALAAARDLGGDGGAFLEARLRLQEGDLDAAFRAARGAPGPGALADLGTALREQQRWDLALRAYEDACGRAPGRADLLAYAGVTRRDVGDWDGAVEILTEALGQKPDYHWAAFALGECLLHLGRPREAALHLALALDALDAAAAPLVDAIFQAGELPESVPDSVLARLLTRSDIDAQRLDLAVQKRLPPGDDALAHHPLTVPWLVRCIVRSVAWQRRLRAIVDPPPALAIGLAVQDWHTEYAYGYSEPPSHPIIDRLLREEPAIEAELAAAIPLLGLSDDLVSSAVRLQYEDHPYPRLVQIQRREPVPFASWLHSTLPGVQAPSGHRDVLVAGGGTGQHPLTTATTFSDVSVLAVDLSRASLAKAARHARQWGVENIRFAQADILALADHPESFDLIESVGVLHHLAEPSLGLDVLVGLLRPGGLMRLGLYSERARGGVVAARELVRDLPRDDDGIRSARQRIEALEEEHPARSVCKSIDYFSLSGCRDLFMHEQEHRFTPLGLQSLLDRAGLDFLGFQHSRPGVSVLYSERFPDDALQRDLANWDLLEAEYPDLFAGMYVFWASAHADGQRG